MLGIRTRNEISNGWKWRLADANGNSQAEGLPELKEWHAVQAFPSVIHSELLANDIIPDFRSGENERLIQWVGHADWAYSTSFSTPKDLDSDSSVDMVFEGLDTFATVTLNGKVILQSDNMFLPQRVDVKKILNPSGQDNEISIVFESTVKKGDGLDSRFGQRKSNMMRGNRRMHIRKAQYHWGWDWGPVVLTAGPYLPIYLDTYHARVDNCHIISDLSPDHSSAEISVDINVAGEGSETVDVRLLDADGSEVGSTTATLSPLKATKTKLLLTSPRLWWPNGQGHPYLYTVKISLLGPDGDVLDSSSQRFGVRKIEIVQRPLDNAPGKTFFFRVNGRDIFSQGGNWIPADNLLPTITRERYFDWIRLAKFNHLNMIRVWGGGIYETEDFLDACDEYGMLVWHDYAFACGDYPIHQEYLDSIKAEAEAQTIRLRNRACMALLCGGNEDFMLCDWLGPKFDFADLTGPFEDKPFPQRKIYLQVLPEVASRLAPNIVYWANSPWGAGEQPSSDLTVGDVHQWHVWHVNQEPYQKYKGLSGRFVSEFGMHGFPIMRTVDVFTSPNRPQDRHPQSRAIDCHNKGHGAETRIARYLAENFRYDNTRLENFAYCTQLLQSEAYGYALRDWKRKFGGKGKEECAGALIWQLNDVYPVTSWAYVDYYLRPKPAFYTIRRSFAPISVGIERSPTSRCINENKPRDSEIPSFSIFAHNTTAKDVKAILVLRAYDFHIGAWTDLQGVDAEREVTLTAGYNTELGKLTAPSSWTEESLIILAATLLDMTTKEPLARIVDWPEPFRYLTWPLDTRVNISVAKIEGLSSTGDQSESISYHDVVRVTTNHPIKGLWLEPVYDAKETEDEPEPLWNDNMFDLLPGEEISVYVKGLRGRQINARFLGDWEVGTSKPRL
ncbi:hypothetical protein LTR84_011311 [Exophiala bonariae]|uniref:Beta-mannosidase B n=1 Tax=Exophiala bonariae TaxID=1690606 RepID=A0AAV9MRZ2_9EURO|nr:hypothetical protein LTR84_011311 [Exophiala bonariae]